jgi:subtilase family serine protease
MNLPFRIGRPILWSALLATSLTGVAAAATAPARFTPVAVDDTNIVRLSRDLPQALHGSYDSGALRGDAVLPHVRLELQRPPLLQAAFDRLTHDQVTRGMPAYHRWITPGQLRAYGPTQADIERVEAWLVRHGLRVNSVSPSGMSIDFGGSAANIGSTFHTQIHGVTYRGEAHLANVTAPAIPTALASVVRGVTLANFFPKALVRRADPNLTVVDGKNAYYAITPADFATIYNVKPLLGSNNFFGEPLTGAGVTIAVVEPTLINHADFQTFQDVFGLNRYPGTMKQINPGNCGSPGTNGDEVEAALDTEWSAAVAPGASILSASCPSTSMEFGVETALMNLVEDPSPATIISVSYGGPELIESYSFEIGWSNLLEEAASEGKSVFVAAGDSGSSADRGEVDGDGLSINGFASTPYDFAVGGTDFYDTALGESTKYFKSGNGPYLGSALSYVPEIPWDNSCANPILAAYVGVPNAFALCASNPDLGQAGVGGGGGQSLLFTKPDWQVAAGVPNDGARDIPDASLFAANGIFGHFYVFCMSDANEGGSPCKYSTADQVFGNAAGGTSFGSPAFAGIAALVQQSFQLGGGAVHPLGLFAPEMYKIAVNQETLPKTATGCNSTLGSGVNAACSFYDVTAGSNAEPCNDGTPQCTSGSSGSVGILQTALGGTTVSAFPATPGYDLATGLGTVNVTNVVYQYGEN